ncbi:MAG: hypothetical protein D6768_18155 [Chloroflexi bacterium]|nr:MAG: hypothetical protein D6768_18155 [Chloroflexota bacterium]
MASLFTSLVQKIQTATNAALAAEESRLFEDLNALVGKLDSAAREGIQYAAQKSYQPILSKLENGQPLTTDERELLKMLVVGRANAYIKTENDLENWRTEIRRLAAELANAEAGGLDTIEQLLHVRALCRDAAGVLPDIAFYYREQERVRRFESALSGNLSAEDGKILADVLRAMMSAENM